MADIYHNFDANENDFESQELIANIEDFFDEYLQMSDKLLRANKKNAEFEKGFKTLVFADITILWLSIIIGGVVSILGLIVAFGSLLVLSLMFVKFVEEVKQLAETVEEWNASVERIAQLIDMSPFQRISIDRLKSLNDLVKAFTFGFFISGLLTTMFGLILITFDGLNLSVNPIRIGSISIAISSLIEIGSQVKSLMSAKFHK